MSIYAIASVLLALLLVAADIVLVKKRDVCPKWVYPLYGAAIIGLMLLFFLWGRNLFADGATSFAGWTFLLGAATLATLIVAPVVWPYKVATYVDMTLFIVLGVTFIVMAIFLSKSVIQPSVSPLVSSSSGKASSLLLLLN